MTANGWIQLGVYVALLAAITKPLGLFLVQVLDPDRAGNDRGTGGTFLGPVLGPVERAIYRVLRVDPGREQTWVGYGVGVFLFSGVTMLVTYGMLRAQDRLPLNPQHVPAVADHVAANTAASFTTNTNWQSYAGESSSGMSYLSQMVALAGHNFFSAAVGIAVAAVLVRGIARERSATVGNFWRDLVRIHLYLLLPLCTAYALFLVSQGMVDNFRPYTAAAGVEGPQAIAQGPVASQVAIKMLGTNGGGFFNANAAHPFENPTPLTDFVQMLSILAIPSGLTYYLGRMVRQQRHGWAVWGAMFALFLVGVLVLWHAEAGGNPRLADLGVAAAGNPEGKEVRFGTFQSALFACMTTDTSCGAVNCMHDSLTPLGGLVTMFNMHLGEVVFGGVGSGLYAMLIFVVLAIFIAGLMVGRTPEYLGKKIEAADVKAAVLGVLAPSLCILGFTAWAVLGGWGAAGTNNAGPHGYSEIHYAYTSGAANNGSAFAGLTAAPTSGDFAGDRHYDLTLMADMLVGRFFVVVPALALAGHLAAKRRVPRSAGTFPVDGPTFAIVLVGVVVIVGALTFLPALAFGPIVEHFQMWRSTLTY